MFPMMRGFVNSGLRDCRAAGKNAFIKLGAPPVWLTISTPRSDGEETAAGFTILGSTKHVSTIVDQPAFGSQGPGPPIPNPPMGDQQGGEGGIITFEGYA